MPQSRTTSTSASLATEDCRRIGTFITQLNDTNSRLRKRVKILEFRLKKMTKWKTNVERVVEKVRQRCLKRKSDAAHTLTQLQISSCSPKKHCIRRNIHKEEEKRFRSVSI